MIAYQQCPSAAVRLKSHVQLSSIDDAVMTTQKAFIDKRLDDFRGSVVISVTTVTGYDLRN